MNLIDSKAITIYGASNENIDNRYKDSAYQLGRLIALSGRSLVCGGGRAGIMRAAIDGATDAGGKTIGVLPEFMIDRQWQHPGLSKMIVTDNMHQRKQTMAELSCAVIACPGGCGTLEELLEMITWRQLGLYKGNVIILNTLDYYRPLIEMFEKSGREGFMRPFDKPLWYVASTPEEAIGLIEK